MTCRSLDSLRSLGMTSAPRKGMTLLEVIVALTVAGGALAAGAAVLGFLTDQQARSGTQAITSAHAVRSTIRDWTSAARLATEGDAEFRGDSTLTFVTSAPTEIAPAGTQVRIYMKPADSDTSRLHGLVADLTPWRNIGPTVTVSLVPDATGFQARYLGSIFAQRKWQSSWVSTSVLPVAVELRVTFDSSAISPERAAHALLALPMTIPLASGGRR